MNSTDRLHISSSFNRAQVVLAEEAARAHLDAHGIPSESDAYRIINAFVAKSGAPEPVIFEAMMSVWAAAEVALGGELPS